MKEQPIALDYEYCNNEKCPGFPVEKYKMFHDSNGYVREEYCSLFKSMLLRDLTNYQRVCFLGFNRCDACKENERVRVGRSSTSKMTDRLLLLCKEAGYVRIEICYKRNVPQVFAWYLSPITKDGDIWKILNKLKIGGGCGYGYPGYDQYQVSKEGYAKLTPGIYDLGLRDKK